MSREINSIIFGVGSMGKIIARYMLDKGINIVGAVNRKSYVGDDLGQVAGLGRDLGVVITNNPESIYQNHDIDIAVISTSSDMASLLDIATGILKQGINVLTISEEAFWPWRFTPEMSHELDVLARENKVTISATGLQDACWFNLIAVVTGACHSIDTISITANANLDFYGPEVLSNYDIGATETEYKNSRLQPSPDDQPPPVFRFPMEALIAHLGLTITELDCQHTPIFASAPVESRSLNKLIDRGLLIGDTEHFTAKTQEGTTIHTQFVEEITPLEKPSRISLDIKGEPDFQVRLENIDGEAITCATTVNRIFDVIDAEPGLITSEKLPPIRIHRVGTMKNYKSSERPS